MAEKDVTEKILMSYADVFADCINTLVYHGERQLNPEDTQPAPTESFYKGEKAHNQFCDASRYLTENGRIALQYIIENETQLEALCDMMEALTGDTRFTEQANELMVKKKGKKIMMCEYINQLEAKGEANGEAKLTALLEKLYDLGRGEDAERAVRDLETRARLYREFSIPGYRYGQ